ncbi:hypothetical protein [Caballeronia sp. BCC1704]|uniref:hypothetical protein n=1 Tax=Caballeronia sp. BCC1704 TaxID=2676300 RepID=UPI001589DE93|nr:hypothetical protein [Caballeronia sp. BCC1704]
MALGLPSVVGPVAEWLDRIVVEGCWPGATIVVQTDEALPTIVAKGIAAGGRDFVPVVSSLKAQQQLVAIQSLAGDKSDPTPSELAVIVSASPTNHTDLPSMSFRSKLYRCGGALWLQGAAPGAVVSVAADGNPIGQGRADQNGDARLALNAKLPGPEASITAIQSAPPPFPPLGGIPLVASGTTSPSPFGKLPTPKVGAPMPRGCEWSVPVSEIIDGAEVTIERKSDGLKETATFDLDELDFQLSAPFPATGDKIIVSQAMPRCHEHPSDLFEGDILPATTPGPLEIEPPCAGSPSLIVSNLVGGASLTITVQDKQPLLYMVPPMVTKWDVPIEPLPENKSVTVTLELCKFSTSATVNIVGASPVPDPTLAPHLYRCARAVSVNTSPRTHLEIWGDYGNGPMQLSPRVHATTAVRNLGVSPYLSVPEKVWVRQISCAGVWIEGPALQVEEHPRLEPLQLFDPLIEGSFAVLPRNAIPGAHVKVWASDEENTFREIIGERDVTPLRPSVSLKRPLSTRDKVWATQELCSESTREGPHYSVIPGVQAFTLSAPMEQLSQSLNGKIILQTGELVCRFVDGLWTLTIECENTDPGYDCSVVVGVDLSMLAPLAFGQQIDMDLAAAGGLPQGITSLGYPSKWTNSKYGNLNLLQNPAFWVEILKANAQWKLLAAWTNYAPVGEKPDWVKGPNAPPDPWGVPPIPNDPGGDDD